jgi:hypothetical protein
VARDAPQRREHAGVTDAAGGDLRRDHALALVRARRIVRGRARCPGPCASGRAQAAVVSAGPKIARATEVRTCTDTPGSTRPAPGIAGRSARRPERTALGLAAGEARWAVGGVWSGVPGSPGALRKAGFSPESTTCPARAWLAGAEDAVERVTRRTRARAASAPGRGPAHHGARVERGTRPERGAGGQADLGEAEEMGDALGQRKPADDFSATPRARAADLELVGVPTTRLSVPPCGASSYARCSGGWRSEPSAPRQAASTSIAAGSSVALGT